MSDNATALLMLFMFLGWMAFLIVGTQWMDYLRERRDAALAAEADKDKDKGEERT